MACLECSTQVEDFPKREKCLAVSYLLLRVLATLYAVIAVEYTSTTWRELRIPIYFFYPIIFLLREIGIIALRSDKAKASCIFRLLMRDLVICREIVTVSVLNSSLFLIWQSVSASCFPNFKTTPYFGYRYPVEQSRTVNICIKNYNKDSYFNTISDNDYIH